MVQFVTVYKQNTFPKTQRSSLPNGCHHFLDSRYCCSAERVRVLLSLLCMHCVHLVPRPQFCCHRWHTASFASLTLPFSSLLVCNVPAISRCTCMWTKRLRHFCDNFSCIVVPNDSTHPTDHTSPIPVCWHP